MGMFEDTALVLGTPFVEIWNNFILALPFIVASMLILIFGYLVGALVGHVVHKVLEKTKVTNKIIAKMNLQEEIGKWDFPKFFGLITKWYIFVVFLNPAAQVVQFTMLSAFFSTIALWIPNIILAIVIVMIGYVLAEYVSKKIRTVKAKQNSYLASGAKIIILIYAVLIALKQIGVNVSLAENTILILLGGVMLGIAIAFGLGFKDEAEHLIKELKKKI